MSGFKLEKTVSLGIIFALAVQTAGALMWGGAAEARLQAVEISVAHSPQMAERMVRLEEQMNMARQSLARIEHRLDTPKN